MENMRICFQAVAPLFVFLTVGYLARRLHQIRDEDVLRYNKLVFNFFLTANQFKSIYFSDLSSAVRPRLIAFAVGGVLAACLLGLCLSHWLLAERAQRGVMTQAVFRSNFILIGMHIAASLAPYEDTASVAVLGAVIIPLYNVLAVVVLSMYGGGRVDARKLTARILKNPLIIATALGLFWLGFCPRLPGFLETAITQMSAVATPMMLFLLGGFFHFESLAKDRKPLILGTFMRLAAVPAIVLPLAYAMGFRGMEFAALLGLFASSSAVSSFTMAQQMGGDVDLAGNLVVITNALCFFTLFGWSLLFKLLGAY